MKSPPEGNKILIKTNKTDLNDIRKQTATKHCALLKAHSYIKSVFRNHDSISNKFCIILFFFGVYFAKKKKKINRKKVLHIFPLSASNKCLLYDFIFLSKYRSEFERMIAGNHEANSENKETTLDNSISIFLYEIFDWFFFFFLARLYWHHWWD